MCTATYDIANLEKAAKKAKKAFKADKDNKAVTKNRACSVFPPGLRCVFVFTPQLSVDTGLTEPGLLPSPSPFHAFGRRFL